MPAAPRDVQRDGLDAAIAAISVARGAADVQEYGRFQQHLTLVEDAGRLGAFWDAIRLTPRGETVVDVGAGTGILALLALRHGFAHAFLIEPSRKMAAYARHLAMANNLDSRVTILESNLETLPLHKLPSSLDLILTETMSSLLFGFGSWDSLPLLVRRLSRDGTTVPERAWLFGVPVTSELATRGPERAGLRLLREIGIEIDLFHRTFRSGGNVHDIGALASLLDGKCQKPKVLARYDIVEGVYEPSIPVSFSLAADVDYCGMLTFWEAELSTRAKRVMVGSLDPTVSSWYPYYIPFKCPIRARDDGRVDVRLVLRRVDTPYPYAFQLMSDRVELTHVLYW